MELRVTKNAQDDVFTWDDVFSFFASVAATEATKMMPDRYVMSAAKNRLNTELFLVVSILVVKKDNSGRIFPAVVSLSKTL